MNLKKGYHFCYYEPKYFERLLKSSLEFAYEFGGPETKQENFEKEEG